MTVLTSKSIETCRVCGEPAGGYCGSCWNEERSANTTDYTNHGAKPMTLFETTAINATYEGDTYRVISGTAHLHDGHQGLRGHKIYLGCRLVGGYTELGNGGWVPMESRHDDWLGSGECWAIVTGSDPVYW